MGVTVMSRADMCDVPNTYWPLEHGSHRSLLRNTR